MQLNDEFLTIAELAIALAGFAGVVVAFSQRGELHAIDRWRFAGLLTLAIGAAVMAFVPSLLRSFGLAGASVWRWSSFAFLVAAACYVAVFLTRVPRLARSHDAMPPAPMLATVFTLSGVNILVQLGNVIGWPLAPQSSSFLIGLLIWIVVATFGFGFLVLLRPRSELPPPDPGHD